MSDEEDDQYLRYCIARLAAFRNVWWSLANEFDFMTGQPGSHRGNKQMGSRISRRGAIDRKALQLLKRTSG